MKKIRFVLLSILALVMFSSCDDMKAVMSLIPKFDGKLPNVIAGKFAYFANENDKDNGEYTRRYDFNNKENKFTLYISTGPGDAYKKVITGKYSVAYTTYTITESNGTIKFEYDDGSDSTSTEFYYYASTLDGPQYILLSDERTYYYWGELN